MPAGKIPFHKNLYFRVLTGIFLGVLLGYFFPSYGEAMKPLGDGFIKLIRMLIAPIVFVTVVSGIASISDLRKLGRVGLKALIYFEAVTTFALLIGLAVVKLVKPGVGINANPATLDVKAIEQYATSGKELHAVDFLLHIIPDTMAGPFVTGEILQVLLLAILIGLALAGLGETGKLLLNPLERTGKLLFALVSIVMKFAPIGAFGAMAFTIGKYGLHTLVPLAKLLLTVYLTCALFVFVVLGVICKAYGLSLWRFLRYISEEILLVLGTSSSESALPRLMEKLERMGCAKSIVGLVVPSGYSFNLDGTAIYLTIAALFVAQATNTNLSLREELMVLLLLMLTSKGAAAVTGGGFVTLAATLSSMHTIPVAGITLLLGVDRFMSEMRSITNLIGNGVATVVISKWEGEFDESAATDALYPAPAPIPAEAAADGPVAG